MFLLPIFTLSPIRSKSNLTYFSGSVGIIEYRAIETILSRSTTFFFNFPPSALFIRLGLLRFSFLPTKNFLVGKDSKPKAELKITTTNGYNEYNSGVRWYEPSQKKIQPPFQNRKTGQVNSENTRHLNIYIFFFIYRLF